MNDPTSWNTDPDIGSLQFINEEEAKKAAKVFGQMQADAIRYRFLRDSENAFPLCFIAQRTNTPRQVVVQFTGETADLMIDEMMRTFAAGMPTTQENKNVD